MDDAGQADTQTPASPITRPPKARQPIDAAALKALTAGMPGEQETSAVFMRAMRDSERY